MLIYGLLLCFGLISTADCRFTAAESKVKLAKSLLIAIVLPFALSYGALSQLTTDYFGTLMDALLISQGFDLLLYGMGTVFTFLTLLVGITSAMSALVNRIASDPAEVTASAAVQAATVEPRLSKIIQAAIDQHRGRK